MMGHAPPYPPKLPPTARCFTAQDWANALRNGAISFDEYREAIYRAGGEWCAYCGTIRRAEINCPSCGASETKAEGA